MKTSLIFKLLFLFLISNTLFARLGDGIEYRGIKFDAKSEIGIGFDDNILLERDNEIEDWYLNFRPYCDLEIPFNPETKAYFSADADIYRFKDQKTENSNSYVFLAGFDFAIRNLYGILLEEYVLPQDRDGIVHTNRIERSNNIPSILLGLDFNRFAIEGIYKRIIARYEDLVYARDEYDEDNTTFKGIFHAFTKTDILVEANYSDLTYIIKGRDGRYFQFRGGLKGYITNKLEGTIKAGYQDRKYYDSTEEFDEAVFEVELLYSFSENKTLDIKYVKSAKESLILGNNFYKLNRISLELKMDKIRGIRLGLGGFFENDKFPFTDNSSLRDDDVIQFFIRAGYQFNNFFTLEARYRYLDRDSNYDIQDYTQNIYYVYGTLKL